MAFETKPCPYCDTDFEFDDRLGAFVYVCPHCGESCELATIRNPYHHPKAEDISRGMSQGMSAHLHKHSLCYIRNMTNKVKVASGTLIEIGSRLLVVTTSHSIPEDPNKKLELLPKHKFATADFRATISDYGFTEKNTPDVGFLELNRDAIFERLEIEPIDLSRLADLGTGNPERKAWMMGYPGDYSMPDYRNRIFKIAALSLCFIPIDKKGWPEIEHTTRDPDENRDVLLRYDRSEDYSCHGVKELSNEPPEPYGMSGGGLWQSPSQLTDDEIWSPERAKLFAIQYMWPREDLFLKATQIVHWLSLVANHYEDLKDEIIEKFPRVAEIPD